MLRLATTQLCSDSASTPVRVSAAKFASPSAQIDQIEQTLRQALAEQLLHVSLPAFSCISTRCTTCCIQQVYCSIEGVPGTDPPRIRARIRGRAWALGTQSSIQGLLQCLTNFLLCIDRVSAGVRVHGHGTIRPAHCSVYGAVRLAMLLLTPLSTTLEAWGAPL